MSYPYQPAAGGYPANWYPDPHGAANQFGPVMRWWDGSAWTDNVQYPTFENQTWARRVSPTGAPYAEWWQRGLGYIIDSLIFLPLYLIVGFIMLGTLMSTVFPSFSGLSSGSSQQQMQQQVEQAATEALLLALLLSLGIAVIVAIYNIAMIATMGRTVGGMAMGIQAITIDGSVPGWARSAKRYGIVFAADTAPRLLAFLPVIGGVFESVGWAIALLCFLSMLWNPNRQAWQDLVGGTYVVKTR